MAKVNELRHSAVVLGNGPGAFLDLPKWSVVLAGLDAWPEQDCPEVHDERLLELVRDSYDGKQVRYLRQPPVFDDPRTSARVPAFVFPGWFTVRVPGDLEAQFGRPLVHFGDLQVKGKDGRERVFRYTSWPELASAKSGSKAPKNWPLVPVRFVRACRFGHCDDVNWEHLVHGGHRCIGTARLWLKQFGASGELSDLVVYCSNCDARYSLAQLKRADNTGPSTGQTASGGDLGYCSGNAPWLRDDAGRPYKLGCKNDEGGPEPWRLLVRHASNAYFARTMATIWLPSEASGINTFLDTYWTSALGRATSRDMLAGMLCMDPYATAVSEGGWSVDDVWAAIGDRSKASAAGSSPLRDPKRPEIERILASKPDVGDSARPTSDFTVRLLPRHRYDADEAPQLRNIQRLFLAHRLRVTTVLRGFTRLEPLLFPVTSEVDLGVRTAPLALPHGLGDKPPANWLPAVANRGEGFILQLDTDAVRQWRQRPAVMAHIGRYFEQLQGLSPNFFSPAVDEQGQREELASFMLLHSLSHALLQVVAMDCGYAPPSLSERIYNYPDAFAIAIYTTSPDADGTLGGLVDAGRSIGRYLADALRNAALCSNDPVCAAPLSKKRPAGVAGGRTVNGAACHACLMVSESSCERRNNDLLDRALLVPTIAVQAGEAPATDLAFWAEVPE